MRKCFIIILTVALIFCMSSVVLANDDVLIHAPDLNDASRLEEIERLKLKIEEEGYVENFSAANESARIQYPIIERRILNVPLYRQEETNYCGPASGKMILDYLLSGQVTQDSVANAMYTDGEGTAVWRLVNGLNSFLSNAPYRYVLTSEIQFSTGLMRSINNNYPVVCHIQTGALPIYNGRDSGHYVVATGYLFVENGPNGIGDEETVYYNDPHYLDPYYGEHTCTVSQMLRVINDRAGFYIMKG